jgi:hypothetical protein
MKQENTDMSNPEFVLAQFEIGDDAKGLARAATYLALQISTGKATKLVASTVYSRASGAAFLVLLLGTASSAGGGTLGTVSSLEAEIGESNIGLTSFAAAANVLYTGGGSPALPVLAHVQSFQVYARQSAIAFASIVLSN